MYCENLECMDEAVLHHLSIFFFQVGERCTSVEEQVACLVDHATDPNILGRTWAGWEPWV